MSRLTEPQPILTPLTASAIFLLLTVRPGGEQPVRDFLPDISGLNRAVGFRYPDARLACVTGIGSTLWDRLFAGPRPSNLHVFSEINGPVHAAPATPGDLLFHIRATRLDLCFELATLLMDRLRDVADVVDEVHGFKYFDERDLLGFVDGTENPSGAVAEDAVLIGDEDADFSGGSYVIVQKYLHDLVAWNALTVEDQERAIGRTKLADVEMADDVKPAERAHRAECHRGRSRQRAKDRARQHAVWTGRSGRVRYLLHRLFAHPGTDRADAAQHVHR